MWSDYNPLDQLVATYQGSAGHNEDAPRPSGLTKLRENTWDQLGRHTAETVLAFAAESRSYTWSGDDRLLSVKLGSASDAPVIKYTYDSSGTRVARSALPSNPGDDAEETRYLADYENLTGYSQILAEVGASEEDSRSYVYGQEHLPLAQLGGGSGAAFFHGDHLGTTRQLTGPSGDALLASPANYSPFGDPENAALSSLTSMAYTGQHRDSATDLQYHRARWLSTEKGRWLSEDPVFDFPANFGNRYGYVGGGNSTDLAGSQTLYEKGGVGAMLGKMANFAVANLARASSFAKRVIVYKARSGWFRPNMVNWHIAARSGKVGLKWLPMSVIGRIFLTGYGPALATSAYKIWLAYFHIAPVREFAERMYALQQDSSSEQAAYWAWIGNMADKKHKELVGRTLAFLWALPFVAPLFSWSYMVHFMATSADEGGEFAAALMYGLNAPLELREGENYISGSVSADEQTSRKIAAHVLGAQWYPAYDLMPLARAGEAIQDGRNGEVLLEMMELKNNLKKYEELGLSYSFTGRIEGVPLNISSRNQ